jgi:predicted ribosomally synthesized peptide with SipW-like signal peptide
MAKSKKIAIVVAAIALIAVIGVVGSTLAYFTDNDQKTNTFTMGNVNGTVEEYKENGEDATPIPEDGIKFDNVTPNAELIKRPFMQLGADSSDAYARIKLTWVTTGLTDDQAAKINALTDTLAINSGWIKGTDDYYYYQTALKKGEKTATIFDMVKIPETWGNDMANITFQLKVEGDFIQADNFTPVTNEAGQIVSWGDVKIEQFTAPETQQTQPAQ